MANLCYNSGNMKTWKELYNQIVEPKPLSVLNSGQGQGQNTTWTASSTDRITIGGFSFGDFLEAAGVTVI